MFGDEDRAFMRYALQEAQAALQAGDYPVGAVLTIDGTLYAAARNTLFTDGRIAAHAEHNLIAAHSAHLRHLVRDMPGTHTCLYTTLEPCLMCLGIAVMHRISRIVIASPDPNGGATALDIRSIGSVYPRFWPVIESGLYREESCLLIEQFLQTEKFASWQTMLREFRQMRMS